MDVDLPGSTTCHPKYCYTTFMVIAVHRDQRSHTSHVTIPLRPLTQIPHRDPWRAAAVTRPVPTHNSPRVRRLRLDRVPRDAERRRATRTRLPKVAPAPPPAPSCPRAGGCARTTAMARRGGGRVVRGRRADVREGRAAQVRLRRVAIGTCPTPTHSDVRTGRIARPIRIAHSPCIPRRSFLLASTRARSPRGNPGPPGRSACIGPWHRTLPLPRSQPYSSIRRKSAARASTAARHRSRRPAGSLRSCDSPARRSVHRRWWTTRTPRRPPAEDRTRGTATYSRLGRRSSAGATQRRWMHRWPKEASPGPGRSTHRFHKRSREGMCR